MRFISISFYTIAIVISAAGCTTTSEQSDIFRETVDWMPSGVQIGVEVSTPHDGAVFEEGVPITVSGFATMGEAVSPVANTSLVFLLDVSGSTDDPAGCLGDGNDDGDHGTVLDCEIEAALAVNHAAIELGSVDRIGAAVFATQGARADMMPGATEDDVLTEPDADLDVDGQLDVEQVLRSIQYGKIDQFTPRKVALATSYGAGLGAIVPVLEASEKPNKLVIMVSDGGNNTDPHIDTVLPLLPEGTTVHTFAIGENASCSKDLALGSLQEISAATGGACTEVPDVSALPDLLPAAIQAQLTGLQLTVDGQPVPIHEIAPQLPLDGPVTIDYSTTLLGLAPGEHQICATASGVDAIDSGEVTECATIIIESEPEPEVGIECHQEFVEATTMSLWPPHHEMYAFSVDDCLGLVNNGCADAEGELGGHVELIGVTSDEAEEGLGDGKTCQDSIMIHDGGKQVEVRAERLGGGDGRVYQATYRLTDQLGVATEATCRIEVPSKKNLAAVASGCGMCVNGSDPNFCSNKHGGCPTPAGQCKK